MNTVVENDLLKWMDQANDTDTVNIVALLDTQEGFEETIEILRNDLHAQGCAWNGIVPFRFIDSIGLSVSSQVITHLKNHNKIRMLVLADQNTH